MPTRARATYLHIGPPKTGTTYLQDVLWHNRAELRRQGVTFPGPNPASHFHAALDLRGIDFGGHEDPRTVGAWPRLVAACRAADSPAVVASHEVFSGCVTDEIDRVGRDLGATDERSSEPGADEGRDLHIVVGVRDLARQLPAVWQESLKNRRTRDFDDFLSKARWVRTRTADRETPPRGFWRAQDTVATLRRWSRVASPDRIHVVTLPASGAPADTLWRRFSGAIGVDPTPFDLTVARPNSSLGATDCELLRRVNVALPADLPWPAYEKRVKRRFNKLAQQRMSGPKVRVPEHYKGWLEDESDRLIAGLREAGYDIVGDLAELVPEASSFASPDDPTASPASVTDAQVSTLVAEITGKRRWRSRGGQVG